MTISPVSSPASAPVAHRAAFRLGGGQDPLGLTIDAAEHDALADQLSQCPGTPITVTLAR
ncbi:hypothetical protein AB0N77_22040 [Streptomyces misionensis]|uniref:hypothetical protein n=1 Tax=Streptomyces misionensis TaxID=67331 RepID=UPI00342F3063